MPHSLCLCNPALFISIPSHRADGSTRTSPRNRGRPSFNGKITMSNIILRPNDRTRTGPTNAIILRRPGSWTLASSSNRMRKSILKCRPSPALFFHYIWIRKTDLRKYGYLFQLDTRSSTTQLEPYLIISRILNVTESERATAHHSHLSADASQSASLST